MIAASYWSLLDPAFDFATQSGTYGDEGQFAWVPVAIGFTAGAAFVYDCHHNLVLCCFSGSMYPLCHNSQ